MLPTAARKFALAIILLILSVAVPAAGQSPRVRIETIQFRSERVGQTLPYSVILPVDYDSSTSRYPTLYLLHGLTGHYTDWLTRTNLADYASAYRLIIITPEGHDGWYTDSATAPAEAYETYIVKELVPDVDARFRTINDRRMRAIAGLSMGGYGALKFGIKYPDLFVFAASMSGALDAAARSEKNPGYAWDFLRPSIMREANDLHRLAREIDASRISSLPFFYLDCGTEDGFLATNIELARILLEKKIPHEFRQLPGGHNWAYWDEQVRQVLAVFARRLK
jgi:S-formylglutathione hydrolase FrmB